MISHIIAEIMYKTFYKRIRNTSYSAQHIIVQQHIGKNNIDCLPQP